MEEELPLRTRWVDYKQYEWDPYVFSLLGPSLFLVLTDPHSPNPQLTTAPK